MSRHDDTSTSGAVVSAFIAAIERKDIDAACELLTEDCEYDNVPMGKVHGREAVASSLGPFVSICAGVDWVVYRQVGRDGADGSGTVMNERLDRFEMPQGWVEVPVAGVFELVDGKIALWRDYFDEATFRSQTAPRS
jgi:limonene-1,2-epoxide hydrolase